MGFAALLFLAFGLAMDATAVAATRGAVARAITARDVVVVGLLFGGAQAVMPALGWLLGSTIGPAAQAFDHWIAFVLLVGLGGKMLWEARPGVDSVDTDDADSGEDVVVADAFAGRLLLTMALATSIDAFAVGITLPILEAPLAMSLLTIGITTAVCSSAAVVFGHRLARAHSGAEPGKKFELAGGFVLVVLGTKILIEHLSA